MNKSIAVEQLYHSKNDLIAQYEQLRAEALNASTLSANYPPGFSIVLRRGVSSWIETYLSSELLNTKQNDQNNQITNHSILNEVSIHKDAVIILTSMVLSHHKLGNCYA